MSTQELRMDTYSYLNGRVVGDRIQKPTFPSTLPVIPDEPRQSWKSEVRSSG